MATGELQYGMEDRCGPVGLVECYHCTNIKKREQGSVQKLQVN